MDARRLMSPVEAVKGRAAFRTRRHWTVREAGTGDGVRDRTSAGTVITRETTPVAPTSTPTGAESQAAMEMTMMAAAAWVRDSALRVLNLLMRCSFPRLMCKDRWAAFMTAMPAKMPQWGAAAWL